MNERKPNWLPETVSTNGEAMEVFARLHNIFRQDFVIGRPSFEQIPVWWDRQPDDLGYEKAFWHLVTRKENTTGDRLLDPPRARKLPWCAPTIAHSADAAVLVWDFVEGSGRLRTYVWLQAWDYCIVLEKQRHRRGTVAFLVTAYSVDGPSTRRRLRKKYNARAT